MNQRHKALLARKRSSFAHPYILCASNPQFITRFKPPSSVLATNPTLTHSLAFSPTIISREELTSINTLVYRPWNCTLDRIFRTLQVQHIALVTCAMRIHGALERVAFPTEDVVAVLAESGATFM
jgi:hypothetical protein